MQRRRARTMLPLAMMASRASSALEDLAYLQKMMPLAAIRSTLQYSRSRNRAISSCQGAPHHERGLQLGIGPHVQADTSRLFI